MFCEKVGVTDDGDPFIFWWSGPKVVHGVSHGGLGGPDHPPEGGGVAKQPPPPPRRGGGLAKQRRTERRAAQFARTRAPFPFRIFTHTEYFRERKIPHTSPHPPP